MVRTRSTASDTCCSGPPGPASVGVSHQNGLGKTGDEYRPGSSPAPLRQMLRARPSDTHSKKIASKSPNVGASTSKQSRDTQTHTLKIYQHNMRGSKNVSDEITKIVGDQGVSLLLAQEIKATEQNGSYTFYGITRSSTVAAVRNSGERPKAAVISFNSGIKLNLLSQFSNTHCVCAEVLAQGFSFYVISHYFQYKDDPKIHVAHLDNVLTELKNKKILIAADVNGRSMLWGPSDDERGKLVEDLINKHYLIVLYNPNTGPTYKSTTGESYIDVTLVTPEMSPLVSNWQNNGHKSEVVTTSDHSVLQFEIGTPSRSSQENLEPARFCLAKADWNKFSEYFKSQTDSRFGVTVPRNPADARSLATEMTNIIIDSCKESMPKKRFFIRSNPWWTRQLTFWKRVVHRARKRYRKARKDHQICGCADCKSIKDELRKNLRKYTRLILKTKRASLRDFVTADANEKPWGFSYKMAAGKLKIDKALNSLRTGTGFTDSMEETAQKLIDYHIPDDRAELDNHEQRQVRRKIRDKPDADNCAPFTIHELRRTIRSMKNGKAPGLDLIEVKVLKVAFKANEEPFPKFFNSLLEHGVFPDEWKEGNLRLLLKGDKDPEEPGSYRPLCLLSTLGKWYEKLIKLRLEESVITPEIMSSNQFGFTRNKSAEDAIVKMREIVKATNENHAIGILFDIKGAFDNVWWPLVLDELRKHRCPLNIYNVISDYFENRKVTLSWGSGKTSKTPTKGCPQGSVLGPSLWNVQFDALLKKLDEIQAEYVVYADDLIVIVKASSVNKIQEKSQIVVDLITSWCKFATLQVFESKTEAIYLRRNTSIVNVGRGGKRKNKSLGYAKSVKNPAIKLNGKSIVFKKSVKYLGVHIDEGLGINTHCEKLKGRMLRLFNDLKRLSGTYWGIKFPAAKIIYKGVFVPTITYAAAGWWDLCNVSHKRKIISAQRGALLAITRAYSTTSSDALQVIAGALPGDLEVDMAAARYKFRKTGKVTFIDSHLDSDNGDKVTELKSIAYEEWQRRWAASSNGRDTYVFFKDVKERSNLDWFQPRHNLVQVVSGHGNFKEYLVKER